MATDIEQKLKNTSKPSVSIFHCRKKILVLHKGCGRVSASHLFVESVEKAQKMFPDYKVVEYK